MAKKLMENASLSHSPLIVVLGCTGTVGSEVMRQLSTHECVTRGILRNPNRSYNVPFQNGSARVSYVTADHESEDQLTRACFGADAMFLLIGTCPEQVGIELRAIKAARRAGVRRIVKLSAPMVNKPASVEVANWHREIESSLEFSGLEYCCLRPYAFMQNWLRNNYTIRYFGKIIGSAGPALRNYVDSRDVAEVAVHCLLSETPLGGMALTLTGPEAISNKDMAERLSLVTGSEIQYKNLSRDAYHRMLRTRAKLPEWLAQHIIAVEELASKVPEQPTDELQRILGRFPRSMDEFLQEFRSAFMRRSLWKFWQTQTRFPSTLNNHENLKVVSAIDLQADFPRYQKTPK